MKRRIALKGIVLFSLGTGVIYSCTDKYQAIKDLNLDSLTFENKDLALLDTLSQMIVPIQNIKALQNHTALPFIMTIVDDIYPPEKRTAFQNGYKTFDKNIENLTGKSFMKSTPEEKMAVLTRLNNREEGMEIGLQTVFDIVKNESLKYLRTSEYYERKVNYYEMAPGRYKGDVLLSELQNANKI